MAGKWQKKPSDAPPRDHYQEVTDQIIAAMEEGKVPWRKPWDSKIAAPCALHNAVTGHRYRGINTLILGISPLTFSTGDPRWCSYKQAQEKGWQVKKGEKSTAVMFFKMLNVMENGKPVLDSDGDEKKIPLLRSFPVFHASQIEGIPPWTPPEPGEVPWRTPEAVDVILQNSGAVVRYGGDRAFFSPQTDHIQLPPKESYYTVEGFASTAMHELGHWTGADKPGRLGRDLSGGIQSKAYAYEELVAELCSVYTSAEIGIQPEFEQHASYLSGWLERLREDKREIFRAAADAQRAADLCLGFHPEYAARIKLERAAEAEAYAEPTAGKPEPVEPSAAVLKAAALATKDASSYRQLPAALREQVADYVRTSRPDDPALAAAVLSQEHGQGRRVSTPSSPGMRM